MSSVLRSYSQLDARQPTQFALNTPSQYDYNLGQDVPVPFVFNNGVLDIALQDDSATLIYNGNSIRNRTAVSFKKMGGLGLVTKIGPNLLTWLQQYWDSGSDWRVSTPSQVYKVQYTFDDNNDSYSDDPGLLNAHPNAWEVMQNKPTDEMVTGDETNRYRTCWVFKTPLVLKTPGGEQFTFHSQLGQNNFYPQDNNCC